MSGHSKWKNIMHKKEKTDAQKAKVFSKVGKEITVCVKEGGPDPVSNSKLRDLIAKAKSLNVPNDNIDRIIKKATAADSANYEEIVYEGYGPSGVAVIVEALTDNRNRTGGDVRHYFDKYGASLGQTGCVSYLFDDKGVIIVAKSEGLNEDQLMEDALEAGAEDFVDEGEIFEIYTTTEDLDFVNKTLLEKGYKIESAEKDKIPQNYVTLASEDDLKKMRLLIEYLEEHDDVQEIYHNWEAPEEE